MNKSILIDKDKNKNNKNTHFSKKLAIEIYFEMMHMLLSHCSSSIETISFVVLIELCQMLSFSFHYKVINVCLYIARTNMEIRRSISQFLKFLQLLFTIEFYSRKLCLLYNCVCSMFINDYHHTRIDVVYSIKALS